MHSRKFTPAQVSYSTTDKELLAIVDALRNFECLLLGIKFTIRTDHMALQTLMKRITPNERQIRWLEKIKVFDFDIEHIDGKENILADALSRIYEDNHLDSITEQDYVGEDNSDRRNGHKYRRIPPSGRQETRQQPQASPSYRETDNTGEFSTTLTRFQLPSS
jgi:hypothetical protein